MRSIPTTWRTWGAACSRRMAGAARDVEHDHVGVERLDPRERRREPAGERRVVAGEQPDLLRERVPDDWVVSAGVIRSLCSCVLMAPPLQFSP